MTGEERIAEAFSARPGRAALMPYLMGGFPDMETSLRIGQAYVDGGADLVELGVPFSDPLADGPVIQEAGASALRAGATPSAVLEVANSLSSKVPVVLMTYSNLVLERGYTATDDLFKWRKNIEDGVIDRRAGTITMLDQDLETIVAEFNFYEAWPCKWIVPEIDSDQSGMAIERIELAVEKVERVMR